MASIHGPRPLGKEAGGGLPVLHVVWLAPNNESLVPRSYLTLIIPLAAGQGPRRFRIGDSDGEGRESVLSRRRGTHELTNEVL